MSQQYDDYDQEGLANPGEDQLHDPDDPWDFANLGVEEQKAVEAEQTAADIYEEIAQEREELGEGSEAEWGEEGEDEAEGGTVRHSGGHRGPFAGTFWRGK